MTDHAATQKEPTVLEAISLLSCLARQTRTLGRGTYREQQIPADFGEIACQVITAVAANLGGVDELLAGRPGSWEADLVRQIVASTAGHDARDVMRYRTAPVLVPVDTDDVFEDAGVADEYNRLRTLAEERLSAAEVGLFDAVATPDQRARRQELLTAIDEDVRAGRSWSTEHAQQVMSCHQLFDQVVEGSDGGAPGERAAVAQAREVLNEVEDRWERARAQYESDFHAHARDELVALGVSADLVILSASTDAPRYEDLAEEISQSARDATAPPASWSTPTEPPPYPGPHGGAASVQVGGAQK